MEIYDDTPAGAVRRAIAQGSFAIKGDAARTVDAMISAADSAKPALRLALGSYHRTPVTLQPLSGKKPIP